MMITRASPSRLCAIPTRRTMPPDSVDTRDRIRSSRFTFCRQSSIIAGRFSLGTFFSAQK